MFNGDRFFILSLLLTYSWNLATTLPINAQIAVDRTLGNESSIINPDVTIKDRTADLVEGGAIRNGNLFHSFSEFNIGDSKTVYFASPDGIANILTRVTGNNSSNIFGTLGVDGAANLFLLNPNGILFGENAILDINGSFLATTADSYIFDRGFNYSASHADIPPLLTMNIPLGLQFGESTGKIINRSYFANQNNIIRGLNISPQQTLSLIGGEVSLDGGYISTSQGNIEIGSVAPENRVNLQSHPSGWTFDYQEVNSFADISISDGGKIDGGVEGGSNIILTGKNISLGYDLESITKVGYELDDFFTLKPLPAVDQLAENTVDITSSNTDNIIPPQISINARETFSIIKGGNLINITSGAENAGAINVTADTVIFYSGGFEAGTQEDSSGDGGVVTFNAHRMSVQNGGGGVNTLGSGNGGTIDLNIANELKIQSGGFGADTTSTGNGGRIEIDAYDLEVISGGVGVNTLGSGNGGTIDLNIANELKIQSGGFGADTVSTGNGGIIEIDAKTLNLSFGGIGVNARNVGKGGQIQIKAETIFLENAGIGAKSGQDLTEIDFDSNELQKRFGRRNAGDGGIIFIAADSLFLSDNSNISTTTLGIGNAGTINLQADSLELRGNDLTTISSSTQGRGDGGNIEIFSNEIAIAGEANIVANSTNIGDAGDISLQANNIIQLQDRGKISVDGGIKGRSGNINLNADKIDLAQESSISAQVNLGNEGNIFLIANNLFLDDLSQITTNAIDDSVGGNIAIDLQDNLVMMGNSQIVATSINGQGGKIQIETTGFFPSFSSAIDASSKFGIDGTVHIDNPNLNHNSDLIKLPNKLIDPSLYLTRGCGLRSNASLVNLGRGGLAENPFNTVINNVVLPDIEIPSKGKPLSLNKLFSNDTFDNLAEKSIIEAEAWKINYQGNIELVTVAQGNSFNNFSDHHFCWQK